MLTAPAKWLIQVDSHLPAAVRPGVLLALVIVLVWLVFVQRALPAAWHALLRGGALTVGSLVGIALYPEYLVANARARHGEAPGAVAQRFGTLADGILDSARWVYHANERERMRWRRPPLILLVFVIAVCAGLWIAMEQTPSSSGFRVQLAQAFDRWRDIEAWADVDPARRAAPGDVPVPAIQSERRTRSYLRVRIECTASTACHGWVGATTSSGKLLVARELTVDPHAVAVYRLHLPKGAPKHLDAAVTRQDPKD